MLKFSVVSTTVLIFVWCATIFGSLFWSPYVGFHSHYAWNILLFLAALGAVAILFERPKPTNAKDILVLNVVSAIVVVILWVGNYLGERYYNAGSVQQTQREAAREMEESVLRQKDREQLLVNERLKAAGDGNNPIRPESQPKTDGNEGQKK